MKLFTNLLYLVPLKIKRFERKNPNEQVILAEAAKAREMNEDSKPGFGFGWAFARRNVLILATDGLHCGNWFIPLSSISDATMIRAATGAILKIRTIDMKHYQFGLNYDTAWEEQSILPLNMERAEFQFSIASLLVRFFLVGILTWSIINDYMQQNLSIFTAIYVCFVVSLLLQLVRSIKYNPKN